MNVIGGAAAGKVIDLLVARVSEAASGADAELRKLIRPALVAAAEEIGLPQGVGAAWLADALLEHRVGTDRGRRQVVGTDPAGTADFEPAAVSERLRNALPRQLRDDLEGQGIDLDRVVERFGPCLLQAVRAAAAAPKSSLQPLAGRMEADALYAQGDVLAAAIGANREDAPTTLDTMEHEARRRIRQRLDAIGVADDEIAAKLVSFIELVPLPEREDGVLVGIVGNAGSGKTTLAERLHLEAIRLARQEALAPLPLFLEATSVGSVPREIGRVWAGVDRTGRGVDVVVDGADEGGMTRGRALVAELRSLARDPRSPVRRAVVTARSLELGLRRAERCSVPPLSDELAGAIVATVAGGSAHAVLLTGPLADAIRWPLFAIAVGALLGDKDRLVYATPSRILGQLARRAWPEVAPGSVDLLARVGAASVDGGHGWLALSRVASNLSERETLRECRLLEVDATGEQVRFPVVVVAEWLAAEHLLNHSDLIGKLVGSPDRLDRWRFPLLLAIESREASAIEGILSTLAREAPGISGWLLGQADPFPSGTLGSPSEAMAHQPDGDYAAQFLSAYDAIGKGIAPASSRIAIFERGRPNPLWISAAHGVVRYAWATNRYDDPDVIADPPGAAHGPPARWISQHASAMSAHPAWTWRHAHKELRRAFGAVRKSGVFFEGSPVYEREREWAVALAACRRRGLKPGSLPIEELRVPIGRWDEAVSNTGQPIPDDPRIGLLRRLVEHLESDGLEVLEGPWPMPDDLGGAGGWVWDLWSDAAFLARLRAVTTAALELYVCAVDDQIPLLAPHLNARRRIIEGGFVGYRQPKERAGPGAFGVPTAWAFVPRESGVSWQLADDPVAALVERSGGWPEELCEGDLHGIFTHRPATLFAMWLLDDDLREWCWGEPGSLPQS